MPENELNDDKEIYTLRLTEWQKNALIQVINNGTFMGRDIQPLSALIDKVQKATKDCGFERQKK